MRRITLLLCLLSMVCSTAYMQNSHTISTMVKGEVCDTLTQERLINAVVQFLSVTDTTQQFVAVTDVQGHFLQPLHPGIYNIRISYMGNIYQATPQRIEVQGNTQDIGQLSIGLSDYALNEVTVVAQKPFVRYDGQKNALQSKCSSIGAR